MLSSIQNVLNSLPQASSIITSLALMMLTGFLMTRITKKLKLPNVTAYLIAGVLLGPHCFKLIPQNIISGLDFLSDVALAFIAFGTGEFFKIDVLKKNGAKVAIITLCETLLTIILVFIVSFYILQLNLAFSIVLAALASATAPASTMMTIRQTNAKGDFVDTLLQVVALDDIFCLIAYSIAIAIAASSISGNPINLSTILILIFSNIGIMILGGAFGFLLHLSLSYKHSDDNRLIIVLAFLLTFCGFCSVLNVSPLLGCILMSMVYVNLSNDDKLYKQIAYFTPPILLLFFVRSGLTTNLNALFDASGSVGATPLFIVAVTYFFVRILGKYFGAFFGCVFTGKSKLVRNYLGLALIPQAGVAIGLAAMGARTLGGESGDALNTIILASSFLYELVGPAAAKFALYKTGSYSEVLEDLVTVEEFDENGEKKSELDMLIERIQKIQEEIPSHYENEAEQAFTSAAEEQYNRLYRRSGQTGPVRR